MPIILVPVTSDQLSRKFNPQTVGILFSHLLSRLFMCYNLPVTLTLEQRARLQSILERLKTYVSNLNRYDTDQNIAETPRIMVLCITILQRSVIGPATDTVIAQFDLSQEGLVDISPVQILTFLSVLIKETMASMTSRYPTTPKLTSALNDYNERIERFIREIASFIEAPPAWTTGPNVIDPFTNVLLRLKVGAEP